MKKFVLGFFLSLVLLRVAHADSPSDFAIIFLLDKSNSISADRIREEFTAITNSLDILNSRDMVGVIGFDQNPFLALRPMKKDQALTDLERVSKIIFPTGSTRMITAVNFTVNMLLKVPARRKHILAFTDGKLPDLGPFYSVTAQRIKDMGITASLIIQTEKETPDLEILRNFATTAGGDFYVAKSGESLEGIIKSDIKQQKAKHPSAKTLSREPIPLQAVPPQNKYEILKDTKVFDAPSSDGMEISSLFKGDRINVVEKIDHWLKLRSLKGKSGFIRAQDAKAIK